MFDTRPTALPGVLEMRPRGAADRRGRFVKVFHRGLFAELGLETGIAEVFFSTSVEGVVRGLHIQEPPHDHAKIVGCVAGAVFDVVLDLRRGSPGFGRWAGVRLSADEGNLLYIPRGVAHGFCVERGTATMLYLTTSVHHPEADTGIRWDSAGIDWPVASPILSDRDLTLPRLADYASPF